MVVGRPMTGKSAILHTLSRALGWDPSMVEPLREESVSMVAGGGGISNINDTRHLPASPFESKGNVRVNRSETAEIPQQPSTASI